MIPSVKSSRLTIKFNHGLSRLSHWLSKSICLTPCCTFQTAVHPQEKLLEYTAEESWHYHPEKLPDVPVCEWQILVWREKKKGADFLEPLQGSKEQPSKQMAEWNIRTVRMGVSSRRDTGSLFSKKPKKASCRKLAFWELLEWRPCTLRTLGAMSPPHPHWPPQPPGSPMLQHHGGRFILFH